MALKENMWLSLPHIFLKTVKIYHRIQKNSIFPNILTILNENLLVVSKFCYTFAKEIKNDGFLIQCLTFKNKIRIW